MNRNLWTAAASWFLVALGAMVCAYGKVCFAMGEYLRSAKFEYVGESMILIGVFGFLVVFQPSILALAGRKP